MTDQNKNEKSKKSKKNGEKILIGEKVVLCFACGEKIEAGTEICPFCETILV